MAKKEERKHTHTHIKPIWNSSTVLEMGVVFLLAAWFFFSRFPLTQRGVGAVSFSTSKQNRVTQRTASEPRRRHRKPLRCVQARHPRFWNAAKTNSAHSLSPSPFLPPLPVPPLSFSLFSAHSPRALPSLSPQQPLTVPAGMGHTAHGASIPPPLPGGGCGHSLRGGAMRCRRSASATAPRL